MGYILKQYDTDLMKFDIFNDFDGMRTIISWTDENKKHLLPLDLQVSEDSLTKWIKGRTIPSNRAYAENFLARLGLNEKNSKGIIDISKGLSLNDSYWIVDEHFTGSYEKYNLYHNRFSTTIAWLAFTGYGSVNRTTFRSSPEFTTNGMLAKCWRRVGGKIILFKSGTEGFAPIFDNGLSLFNYAMDDDLRDIKAYAKTRSPATYPDFVQFVKETMDKRQKDMLRKLLEFKFKKHPRYNLDDKRIKIIENFIHNRAKELLVE